MNCCSPSHAPADRRGRNGPAALILRLTPLAVILRIAGACTASDAQLVPHAAVAAPRTDTSVYANTHVGNESPAARLALARVYVPNTIDHTVSVIDPVSMSVIATIPTGQYPEHVIVAHDLRSLWIASTRGNALTRIDPTTGRADPPRAVEDPYNVYFTPDGATMIVITERDNRLDFRNAATLALEGSVRLECR